MKHVRIFTDGSCAGNPGPGGWAAILQSAGRERELTGYDAATTNNRMELQAALEGLRALTESCAVELWTDSLYLKNGMTEWLPRWKRNGWRTAEKKPVKNADLWQALDEAVARHHVSWLRDVSRGPPCPPATDGSPRCQMEPVAVTQEPAGTCNTTWPGISLRSLAGSCSWSSRCVPGTTANPPVSSSVSSR